jgi:hypothetical protein
MGLPRHVRLRSTHQYALHTRTALQSSASTTDVSAKVIMSPSTDVMAAQRESAVVAELRKRGETGQPFELSRTQTVES